MTRRGLVLGSLALMAGGCTPAVREAGQSVVSASNSAVRTAGQFAASAFRAPSGVDPRYRRRRVRYDGNERPGTIVVDTPNRYLYFVEEGGWATRYGVGVGREGLAFKGRARIGRKAEWPPWAPTENMMRRDPRLVQYAGGLPGGPNNPLGARALYLYRNGRDTMFRLHGTNEPWSIGQAVSSGCIRLMNEDVIHLYDRTPVGTTVVVL
jgi:lipoprotein-anchoring transpeptidase ErfK/SrfK